MGNRHFNLVYGFNVAFQFDNLLFCAIGVLVGTLVGVLPGIGPIGAMALLLPVTFKSTHPSLNDWGEAKWAIARGSIIGFLLGILPGGGAILGWPASQNRKIGKIVL